VNNAGTDGLAILSPNHTCAFDSLISDNHCQSISLALNRIPHADLLVSGEKMDSPIPQIRYDAISQELGRSNWFFVMDTERAAIHYKEYGETFELCLFDWAWIAGNMNI